MENVNIFLVFLSATCFLILLYFLFKRRSNRKHKYYIKQSNKILNKIRSFEDPHKKAKQISYLKKINPYVFEELILTSLERQGHKIFRNKSYSGDGGIDGKVIINNILYYIQAKRYDNHIKKEDIILFSDTCKRENVFGLFIHTGKTRNKHFNLATTNNIEIISGQRLLNMLGI